MDEINSPKHYKNKEWIHDLLDEESFDETYKFELTSETKELTDPQISVNSKDENIFKSADAWTRFNSNLNAQENKKTKSIPLRFQWLKYAAIIALPILAGSIIYFLRYNTGDSNGLNYHAANKQELAKGVMLLLDNGTQIDLKKPENSTVLNGTVINTADQLDYTKSVATAAFNTLIVPKGTSYKLLLDDGTQVWVNADTRIKYQVSFDNTPTREVYLESGEAFFKVTKNPNKPFIVHKGAMQIQVLGTSFNVNTYSDEIQTTLVEGKVKIGLKNTDKELILNPGQQAKTNLQTAELSKQNVDPYLFTAWKDGVLIINNATMETLMAELGRLYDYQIVFEDKELKKLHYDGSTDKSVNIKPLLDMIEKTTDVKFTIKDRRIIVKKDN